MLDIFARDLSDLNASIICDHLQMYLEIELFKIYNNPIIKSMMRERETLLCLECYLTKNTRNEC